MRNIEIFVLYILAFVSFFVSAWGLMVFWNQVVLNVWQLFTSADVLNTMQISYGVFFVIAMGLNMIKSMKTPASDLSDAFSRLAARVILILTTLLSVAIVF